jgi:hypothetical protein
VKCQNENECNGEINITEAATCLQVGCRAIRFAYACEICGRLHFLDGDKAVLVQSRGNERAFLENGEVVNKP